MFDKFLGYLQLKLKLKTVDENEKREIKLERLISGTMQDKIHVFLVNFDFPFKKIKELELTWKRFNGSDDSRQNRGYKLRIPYIEVNFMSSLDAGYDQRSTNCPLLSSYLALLAQDSQEPVVHPLHEGSECQDCCR